MAAAKELFRSLDVGGDLRLVGDAKAVAANAGPCAVGLRPGGSQQRQVNGDRD